MARKTIHRPNIIDIEASGMGRLSYPIEIGLALTDKDRYCSLIKPCGSWTHWDKKAEAMHCISRKLLMENGIAIRDVARKINSILGRMTVYSDGWVVDKPWLSKLFEKAGIRQTFHISPLEMILSEAQMEIWHATKDDVVRELNVKRHRASIDAFVIQETYMQTQKITQ